MKLRGTFALVEYVLASKRYSTRLACLAAVCCYLASTGCHKQVPVVPEADQIRDALNAYYVKTPACLWMNPVTLQRTRGAETATIKELRALDNAGLIDRERRSSTLTNAGKAFWRADPAKPDLGNLCFGTLHVDRVTSLKERPDGLFGSLTEAAFQVSLLSPALWTRVPAMQQAFPLMAAESSGPMPLQATLRHTDKGWQVAVIEAPAVEK